MKKAIFIDGPSLYHMLSSLGMIESVSYGLLKKFLEGLGSSKELAAKPTVVLHPTVHDGKTGKAFRTADFNTLSSPTLDGEDDQLLISKIGAVGEDVKEIIIVSSDQDFVPVLREKVDQGARVYWVAAKIIERGNNILGRSLLELFGNGLFTFIDLDTSATRQALIPSLAVPLSPTTISRASPRPLKLTVEDATLDDRNAFLRALTELAIQFPDLKLEFEV